MNIVKPRKPMKRTEFRREGPTRKPSHEWTGEYRNERPVARMDRCDEKVRAVPKHEYVRSRALMKAYLLIPCQNCGNDDGTVCGAHSNFGAHGKGRGIKADDNRAASLCWTCHTRLDQGHLLSAAERFAMWWAAHVKTVRELVRRCLWPAAVPVPDLELSA